VADDPVDAIMPPPVPQQPNAGLKLAQWLRYETATTKTSREDLSDGRIFLQLNVPKDL
jgi:hypothetical protein